MKRVFTFLLALVMVLTLCACASNNTNSAQNATVSTKANNDLPNNAQPDNDHVHKWYAATCKEPRTCSICGKTEGSVGAHKWEKATCQTPKTCSVCNVTEGSVGDHKWKKATCKVPKTCTVCGTTEGTTGDHSWRAATCTTSKTCTVCGTTTGSTSSHNWKAATCVSPKTCTSCGATQGGTTGHSYAPSGDRKCYYCGKTQEEEILSKCSLQLPALPCTISYCSYSGERYSSVKVTKIVPEFTCDANGNVTIEVKFSGTKTYDYRGVGQSDSCHIGWKLYDSSGNVIESGTFYSPQVAVGESFANQKETLIYSWDGAAPGAYRLAILDVN